MSKSRLLPILLLSMLAPFAVRAYAGEDFKPVPPEELAMKDNPKQPGAHAMILEWSDVEDGVRHFADHYERVKIFTDEGKKYADVQIPYFKGQNTISDIKARTIHPDGSTVAFAGKVFDTVIAKKKGVKYEAKTFTLPDVQPGSIIEYRYKSSWRGYHSVSIDLQAELFIKRGVFSVRPANIRNLGLGWTGEVLPGGRGVQERDGVYTLQIDDAPAFESEVFSPPDEELKPHITFFYLPLDIGTKENFWKRIGQAENKDIENFIGSSRHMQKPVAEIVSPADPLETKLKKIYDRVQKLTNLSFAREKTDEEIKREKLKNPSDAADVLNLGYGYHSDINRLYAALVRAAGVDAEILPVSQRDRMFFKPGILDPQQLSSELVIVRSGDKQWYLDPGTPMCPFGLVPWKVSGSQAYQVNKEGGTFVMTPAPLSEDAVTKRVAGLKLDQTNLTGRVRVEYGGQEALRWRLAAIDADETELKTELEDQMKSQLPNGSSAIVTSIENARDEYQPFIVKFDVNIPSAVSTAGSKTLLALDVFQSNGRNPFVHESRTNPVYFEYPFEELDDVTLEIPKDLVVAELPHDRTSKTGFASYATLWSQDGSTLIQRRKLTISSTLIPVDQYPQVRSFYERVNKGDHDEVVFGQKAK